MDLAVAMVRYMVEMVIWLIVLMDVALILQLYTTSS